MCLIPRYAGAGRIWLIIASILCSQSLVEAHARGSTATVFVIVMENHSWSSIHGSASAPYINKTLLPVAARAEQYYTPRGLHPSLPNYLWLEAGTNFQIRDDVSPAVGHQRTGAHLVTLLNRSHISWRAYEEGITGKVCPLYDQYPYATRHNPMVYFDDTTHGNDPRSRYCIAHERPSSDLKADLRNDRVARYNFITPSVCSDMHDSCAPLHNPVRQGDSWLARTVPFILTSRAYRRGGALFILWDEGDADSDGPLGMLVLSPNARRGYVSGTKYTHSSTLRTIEEIFRLKRFLGGAQQSNDLRKLFVTLP